VPFEEGACHASLPPTWDIRKIRDWGNRAGCARAVKRIRI
jgi:hypothetical protein